MLRATSRLIRQRESRTRLVKAGTNKKVDPCKQKTLDALLKEVHATSDVSWLSARLEARPIARHPVVALKVLTLIHRVFRDATDCRKVNSLVPTVSMLQSSWQDHYAIQCATSLDFLRTLDPSQPGPGDADEVKRLVHVLVCYSQYLRLRLDTQRKYHWLFDGRWCWGSYLSESSLSSLAQVPVTLDPDCRNAMNPVSFTTLRALLAVAKSASALAQRVGGDRVSGFFSLFTPVIQMLTEDCRFLFRTQTMLGGLLVAGALPFDSEDLACGVDPEGSERAVIQTIVSQDYHLPIKDMRALYERQMSRSLSSLDGLKSPYVISDISQRALQRMWMLKAELSQFHRTLRGLLELVNRLSAAYPGMRPTMTQDPLACVGHTTLDDYVASKVWQFEDTPDEADFSGLFLPIPHVLGFEVEGESVSTRPQTSSETSREPALMNSQGVTTFKTSVATPSEYLHDSVEMDISLPLPQTLEAHATPRQNEICSDMCLSGEFLSFGPPGFRHDRPPFCGNIASTPFRFVKGIGQKLGCAADEAPRETILPPMHRTASPLARRSSSVRSSTSRQSSISAPTDPRSFTDFLVERARSGSATSERGRLATPPRLPAGEPSERGRLATPPRLPAAEPNASAPVDRHFLHPQSLIDGCSGGGVPPPLHPRSANYIRKPHPSSPLTPSPIRRETEGLPFRTVPIRPQVRPRGRSTSPYIKPNCSTPASRPMPTQRLPRPPPVSGVSMLTATTAPDGVKRTTYQRPSGIRPVPEPTASPKAYKAAAPKVCYRAQSPKVSYRADPRVAYRVERPAQGVDVVCSTMPKDCVIDYADIVLHEKLGHGATADVYRGTWRGTEVAVKNLKTKNSDQMAHLLRELAIMVRLRHPNIVLLMGCSYRPLSVVTECCRGGTLFSLLHPKDGPPVRIGLPLKRKIALDVALGCLYLHSLEPKIIHRDLKSLNILLTDRVTSHTKPDSVSAKVADFGLSHNLRADTHEGGPAGTYHWMAPEVLQGGKYDEKVSVRPNRNAG
ncbi:MAG: uncharacterized protein KVP18_003621 [Porospora cf. gigantea A]|uniref:uncharacterized protein n=1 Tax=Porospora cf. gigantea A TaxID=2853593 RepID=UPI003559C8F7|nr:MAG: hypothetical protein KVP18_003621 [Porospora cf. gigantea A]